VADLPWFQRDGGEGVKDPGESDSGRKLVKRISFVRDEWW
jgi:hypothetical protein